MFGLFQQNTPQYAGNGQPTATGREGTFGFLSGLIATSVVPPYATADLRPSTTGGNYEPVTLTSETSEQVTTQCACVRTVVTQEPPSEQLAAPACSVPLPFAIVIQRPQE